MSMCLYALTFFAVISSIDSKPRISDLFIYNGQMVTDSQIIAIKNNEPLAGTDTSNYIIARNFNGIAVTSTPAVSTSIIDKYLPTTFATLVLAAPLYTTLRYVAFYPTHSTQLEVPSIYPVPLPAADQWSYYVYSSPLDWSQLYYDDDFNK